MILTSYLYVGVHYRKNNGISSEVAPISIVTLWINVDVVNRCWKQWAVSELCVSEKKEVCACWKQFPTGFPAEYQKPSMNMAVKTPIVLTRLSNSI
jgi:hypothetical protein